MACSDWHNNTGGVVSILREAVTFPSRALIAAFLPLKFLPKADIPSFLQAPFLWLSRADSSLQFIVVDSSLSFCFCPPLGFYSAIRIVALLTVEPNRDMGDNGSEYPSPRSQGPSGSAGILVAQAYDPTSSETAKMAEQISQEQVLPQDQSSSPPGYGVGGSKRPRMSIRRARDPPKTPEGQIYCDHIDCHLSPPYFKRPCEWK